MAETDGTATADAAAVAAVPVEVDVEIDGPAGPTGPAGAGVVRPHAIAGWVSAIKARRSTASPFARLKGPVLRSMTTSVCVSYTCCKANSSSDQSSLRLARAAA